MSDGVLKDVERIKKEIGLVGISLQTFCRGNRKKENVVNCIALFFRSKLELLFKSTRRLVEIWGIFLFFHGGMRIVDRSLHINRSVNIYIIQRFCTADIGN